MRQQFCALERHKWQLIWEGQQGLPAQAPSTKAHRWSYPEPPSSHAKAHTPVGCTAWERLNPSGLCGGHILSPAWRICSVLGQALAMGRCPSARQQQQGRWLWWQWLLFCQLYIFFSQVSDQQTPSVPLDLPIHSPRVWLHGAEVSRAVADPRARRDSSQKLPALTSPFVPAACRAWRGSQNHPGMCFTQHCHPPAQEFLQKTSLSPKSPVPTPALLVPNAHLESNQGEVWWSWLQLGQILPSLFTVSCAVGIYRHTEISGIMNTN